MAPQTSTQRRAAAKKAAATRKRNAATRSTRRARSSARGTARSARATARQATRGTTRRTDAEATRLRAVAERAERVFLIPVGAILTARDNVVATARRYSTRNKAQRQLDKFERRGATALRRGRRGLRREVEHAADGLRTETEGVIDCARTLA